MMDSKTIVKVFAVLLVAAGLGAVLAPPSESNRSLVQARRDVWTLAEMPRKPDLLGLGLAMVSSPIFEPEAAVLAAAAAAAAPPEDKRWRIAGLIRRGNVRSVLINFVAPGKEPLTLHVGERLPSGHRIARIDDAEVCVQLGNKTYRLGVEYRD